MPQDPRSIAESDSSTFRRYAWGPRVFWGFAFMRFCPVSIVAVLTAGAAAAQVAPVAPAAVPVPAAIVAPAPPPSATRQTYVDIVRREAVSRGLPPEVAEAVAQIESGYNPSAVGGVGEIGLMQIRPATAEMLGHSGGALALFDPETNARYAVRYLAEAWKRADGDLCRALMKYRAGHNADWMSPLSADYCMRAKAYLATIGSPLAAGVSPGGASIVSLPGDQARAVSFATRRGPYLGWKPGRHTDSDNARFWARHEARIKALTGQIMARRKVKVARGD